MITKDKIERFYKDVEGLGLRFPVAAISKATKTNKGNVSSILSRKLEPSESFLNKFYEAFKDSITNVSRGTLAEEPETDYMVKNKYIASLERENERLRKDLNISLGGLRHNALLARAVAETNQQLLIELLVKQRKSDQTSVRLEVNRVNGENYKRMKEVDNHDGVGI